MIAKSHRWQKTAIVVTAIALFGFTATTASALSLGRITVQSSLGEPLRAELDVPDISADEAASLKTSVAAPAAFTAAGLDYNAAMSGLQLTLMRRPDGTAFILLASESAINARSVDLLLEATWSSGRIVRDYTLSLNPPAPQQEPVAPTLPQVPASVPAEPSAEAPQTAPPPAPTTQAEAAPPAAPATAGAADARQVVIVKEGDTAGEIALRTKGSGVSLDQMLVALIRSNPDAFITGNVNRIRSGAVLNLPSADQATAMAPEEASQIVIAHSKDFNDFRRNLATNAPKTPSAPPDRKARGTVDTKVEDQKPAAATPDKLTLSKGSVQGKAEEASIAKERAEKEAAARAAEIAKNMADLAALNAASATQTPPAAPAPAPTAAASAAEPAATPGVPVTTAAPVVAPVTPVAPVPVPAEPQGLLDALLSEPLVPAAGGGLLALLGGFGFYRMRQRKKNTDPADSVHPESPLQPEADAEGDVDPVTEADVYIAYGKDVQAEEILKEAVVRNPERLAIHTKLLEIFAMRRDAAGFQASAEQAFKLTGAYHPEWTRICELGLGIDPQNPLYQPRGGILSALGSVEPTPTPDDAPPPVSDSMAVPAANTEMAAPQGHGNLDLDLNLDFSAGNDQTANTETPALDGSISLDFDVSGPADLNPEPAAVPDTPGALEFDLGSLSLELDPPAASLPAAESPPPAAVTPLEAKLALAEEFVSIGDDDGARALIEEVMSEATGDLRAKAKSALSKLR